MRSAFGVPAFVIEFLLGKYCASTDEEAIHEGLEFVRETLSAKYVKPDEREAVKSAIKQHTTYEIIDKISVAWSRPTTSTGRASPTSISTTSISTRARFASTTACSWAASGQRSSLRYDDSFIFKGQNRPFFVESIRPIQLSTPQHRAVRRRAEALHARPVARPADAVHGLRAEPSVLHAAAQAALHAPARCRFVEKNYNSVELGPRGTGKSFVYQQMSPYCHLVSGGQTTTAQMFVNLASGQRGLVACGTSSRLTRPRASGSPTRPASTS